MDKSKKKAESPGTSKQERREQAKQMGFTGVECPNCGSFNSIPNGTCALCTNCNNSIGGCS